MTTTAPDDADAEAVAHTIDSRDVDALTACMTVLGDTPRVRGAGGMYEAVSDSGATYVVDERDGACECADARYRDLECKHIKRVRYAIGRYAIPAWADRSAIDPLLGRHVESV